MNSTRKNYDGIELLVNESKEELVKSVVTEVESSKGEVLLLSSDRNSYLGLREKVFGYSEDCSELLTWLEYSIEKRISTKSECNSALSVFLDLNDLKPEYSHELHETRRRLLSVCSLSKYINIHPVIFGVVMLSEAFINAVEVIKWCIPNQY